MTRISNVLLLALVLALASGSTAAAQSAGPWGRVSFTTQSFTADQAGQTLPGFSEMVVSATFASPTRDDQLTEYRFDFRGAGYPQTVGRARRISLYDAYIGRRLAGGVGVRVGQMWLNDLGALGSLGGVLTEVVRQKVGGFRRIRIGAFGGLEPQVLDAGYVPSVFKAGGYVTLERAGAWRNTVGFVTVRNSGLTERSVLTTTNFLPFGRRLMFYQAAEYDLSGPAGNGSGGLNYLFANGRYQPVSFVELQGVYHRGRSIDVRSITTDQLAGRPVSAKALEGLLYESIGGRATITVARDVRVFAGYTKDRNNREDLPTARITFGGFATNPFRSGLDVNISDSRMQGPSASYDSWDASIGRSLGVRMYVTIDYSTSLSTFQMLGQDGFLLQTRPRTNRYSLSDLIRVTRSGRFSVLATADRTRDGDLTELRWLASLIYRF
jgi:hypothetical protein